MEPHLNSLSYSLRSSAAWRRATLHKTATSARGPSPIWQQQGILDRRDLSTATQDLRFGSIAVAGAEFKPFPHGDCLARSRRPTKCPPGRRRAMVGYLPSVSPCRSLSITAIAQISLPAFWRRRSPVRPGHQQFARAGDLPGTALCCANASPSPTVVALPMAPEYRSEAVVDGALAQS